jgi:hypothetical protein
MKYFAPAIKQMNRIETITRSPVLSYMAETL